MITTNTHHTTPSSQPGLPADGHFDAMLDTSSPDPPGDYIQQLEHTIKQCHQGVNKTLNKPSLEAKQKFRVGDHIAVSAILGPKTNELEPCWNGSYPITAIPNQFQIKYHTDCGRRISHGQRCEALSPPEAAASRNKQNNQYKTTVPHWLTTDHQPKCPATNQGPRGSSKHHAPTLHAICQTTNQQPEGGKTAEVSQDEKSSMTYDQSNHI